MPSTPNPPSKYCWSTAILYREKPSCTVFCVLMRYLQALFIAAALLRSKNAWAMTREIPLVLEPMAASMKKMLDPYLAIQPVPTGWPFTSLGFLPLPQLAIALVASTPGISSPYQDIDPWSCLRNTTSVNFSGLKEHVIFSAPTANDGLYLAF